MLAKSDTRTMMIQNIYQELLHLKVTRNGIKPAYFKGFCPFLGNFEGAWLQRYAYIILFYISFLYYSGEHTMNFQTMKFTVGPKCHFRSFTTVGVNQSFKLLLYNSFHGSELLPSLKKGVNIVLQQSRHQLSSF